MISRHFAAALLAMTVAVASATAFAKSGASEDIPAASAQADASAEAALKAEEKAETDFMKSAHPQTGNVHIAEADATLALGANYYFLDKTEAKKVIEDLWHNPPGSADDVLGLVVPAGRTPFNDWGAVVTFDKSGYVSDKDASTADYNKSLKELQDAEVDNNKERQKQGYPTTHVVGWAQPPSYDKAHHYLVWARDIKFGDSSVDTLNYDVRVLGRRGVLSLNMVATMPELVSIRSQAVQLAAAGQYNSGARYEDYKEGDSKAAYGLAGLVAAGLGLAVVKKLGLLGIILAFGKKAVVLIVAAFAAIGRWFSSRFGKKKTASATIVSPQLGSEPAGGPDEAQAIAQQEPTVRKD